MAAPPACHQVLGRIRALQDGNGVEPSHADALAEVVAGRKRGHWIWYVWPALRGVRTTRRPDLELPDFAAARAYVRDEALLRRLLEVTAAAVVHLEAGLPPARLFGAMRCDAEKFHEAVTLFSAAAAAEGLDAAAAALRRAVAAYSAGAAPHAKTVAAIAAHWPPPA